MSLEVEGASFRWPGGKVALDEAGLSVERGRAVAVLGPNGAGKSTLLRVAAGVLAPASGRVLLDSRSLGTVDPRARAKRIALLPQFERLPFNYSCLEFVLLGRAPHVPFLSQPGRGDLDRVFAALAQLGLEPFAGRSITELSGGELQLVRLARCLAQEADYLLLDEPTTMLDPANARLVADAMRDIVASGAAVAFSTHDAAFAAFAADEAVLVRGGSLIATGPARAVIVPELLESAFGAPFGNAVNPSVFGV